MKETSAKNENQRYSKIVQLNSSRAASKILFMLTSYINITLTIIAQGLSLKRDLFAVVISASWLYVSFFQPKNRIVSKITRMCPSLVFFLYRNSSLYNP